MKRTAIFVLLSIFFFISYIKQVNAITPSSQNRIEARVGEYSLTVSGFASQNASITIKTDSILMASTTALANGTFSFSKLPIKKGFTSFCFETIDAARIGKSFACMKVPPATNDIVLDMIYLPPTIGLEKQSITEGSSGLAYGYTMPNASIDIKANNGSRFTAKSNETGRYSYTIGNLPIGSYEFSSRGTYQGSDSLTPLSTVTLRVLTSSAAFTNEAVSLRRVLSSLWPWIFLSILILGLLTLYLIKRFRPEWLRFITESKAYSWLLRRLRRSLHHSWFVGY